MRATATPTHAPVTAATLPSLLADASRHPNNAIRRLAGGPGSEMSHRAVYDFATATARGLVALGIRPGERVAVLGSTVPEWTLADLGSLLAGAVVVPVYHTNSPEECAYVLEHSGSRAVFCEDEAQLAKVREIQHRCPDLEHLLTFGPAAEGAIGIDELHAAGKDLDIDALDNAAAALEPDDPATVVYTSGTTGPPKGCILTHRNIMSTVAMVDDQLDVRTGETPVVFMFLPLAHVFARVVQFVTLGLGGELVFWRGDPATLLDDVREARPTHFPSVPRVFEKIHTVALSGLEEADPIKRAMFGWAMRVGAHQRALERRGSKGNPLDQIQHGLAERLVLKKVQALFGGRLERAIVGAAPIGVEILEFFDAAGVPVDEGYGMTETCAATTLNTPWARRLGAVGQPLRGVDVRIADDGEILMRGPNISPGYLHDDAATQETYGDDGWLRSGDLGSIDDDGFLFITGRKKDLIITSSGKNITPSNIETRLRETRWISQAVVYGDNKPYLVALITLDPDELEALAEHAGVEHDGAEQLGNDPAVRALLHQDVEAINADFAKIEQIKRFGVLPRDLTQVDGELTPTLKVKRALVNDRFRDRFEALYED